MPTSFFAQLQEMLAGGPVALSTVVAFRGSAPRVTGARMAVTSDGQFIGSVGGGAAEGRVLEDASAVLAGAGPQRFFADLTGHPGAVKDGICGGTMEVLTVQLDPASEGGVIRDINARLAAGTRVVLDTRFQGGLVLQVSGTEPPPSEEAFRQVLEPDPLLLIVGAGHVGRSLAAAASLAGFQLLVQDDRDAWLEAGKLPARATCSISFPNLLPKLSAWQGLRCVAMVTRGFIQDLTAWEALGPLVSELDYFGVMGSQRRVRTVLAEAEHRGLCFPRPEALHAPIGLEIGAETPEEIAVSIVAELIQYRRRRTEAALRAAFSGEGD